ncbi:hypothetical protein J4233_00305 [Candidatus Pacearchaeota archaeon]|nr:hypothetical protein [Candidatus Pacearchaeota archaeon]
MSESTFKILRDKKGSIEGWEIKVFDNNLEELKKEVEYLSNKTEQRFRALEAPLR